MKKFCSKIVITIIAKRKFRQKTATTSLWKFQTLFKEFHSKYFKAAYLQDLLKATNNANSWHFATFATFK